MQVLLHTASAICKERERERQRELDNCGVAVADEEHIASYLLCCSCAHSCQRDMAPKAAAVVVAAAASKLCQMGEALSNCCLLSLLLGPAGAGSACVWKWCTAAAASLCLLWHHLHVSHVPSTRP